MVTILNRCYRLRLNTLMPPTTQLMFKNFTHQDKYDIRKKIYKKEKVKKMRMNILQRYIEYVKNYDKVIEKRFPTAMHLYRTFKGGVQEFARDLKTYIGIIRRLQTEKGGLKTLTLKEIELYHKMPKDMYKIAPVLILSTLPLANYVIFPLTYFFPRQMLCTQFWTLQQRSEFQLYYLKQRLKFHRPTFRCLQAKLNDLKKKSNPLFKPWAQILGHLGSGSHPCAEEILECVELFSGAPYHYNYMTPIHIKNLLKMHGMSTSIWFRRNRLRDRARLIQAMDQAICREDGVENMCQDSMRYACIIRGVNPMNMSHSDMILFLTNWLKVSNNIEPECTSVLLHCPILLAYNLPSNWRLIYEKV